MGVEWAAPFTWSDFPITHYTLRVINQATDELLENETLHADTRSYYFTQSVPSSCTNLTFNIIASSSIGNSEAGVTQGSFPLSNNIAYIIFYLFYCL